MTDQEIIHRLNRHGPHSDSELRAAAERIRVLGEALKAADSAMGMHGPCKNNSCSDCRRATKMMRAALYPAARAATDAARRTP